jgi:hypothetical protein
MRSNLTMLAALAFGSFSSLAAAQATAPDKDLQPLGFLVGRWEGGGAVATSGGRSHGVSTITVEADGRVLLRKDRNELFDKAGKPSGGFGQIMTIYAENGEVRGDYVDGEGHVIHYGPATIVAGKSAEFTSVAGGGQPAFHLRYEALDGDTLRVVFEVRLPGQTRFLPIASGDLRRVR